MYIFPGRGAAMIIESLCLFYHMECFKCCVCHVQLGDGLMGTDVRVRNQKLHCHNCYSSDDGVKFSCVQCLYISYIQLYSYQDLLMLCIYTYLYMLKGVLYLLTRKKIIVQYCYSCYMAKKGMVVEAWIKFFCFVQNNMYINAFVIYTYMSIPNCK